MMLISLCNGDRQVIINKLRILNFFTYQFQELVEPFLALKRLDFSCDLIIVSSYLSESRLIPNFETLVLTLWSLIMLFKVEERRWAFS